MSKISLKHSGGNVVSLNSPTSAPTSADVAFKLPNADGTSGQAMVTDASGNLSFAATGKILQVVSTTKTDTFSSSTINSFVDITGLSVTITPTATSSKILVLYDTQMSGSELFFIQLVRGSTAIKVGDSDSGNRVECTLGGDKQEENTDKVAAISGHFLDSPSTTSATTYKLQGRIYSGGGSGSFSVNKPNTDSDATYTGRGASTITVMEVAA